MNNFIVKYLSPESFDKLKADPGYDNARREADQKSVRNILLKKHRPGYNNAAPLGQKAAANDLYYQLVMSTVVMLVDLKRDFIMMRGIRTVPGHEEIPEPQPACDFLRKLGATRLGNFRAYINNQIATKSKKRFALLHLAIVWEIPLPKRIFCKSSIRMQFTQKPNAI